jgi:hypothetical protein
MRPRGGPRVAGESELRPARADQLQAAGGARARASVPVKGVAAIGPIVPATGPPEGAAIKAAAHAGAGTAGVWPATVQQAASPAA